MFVHVVSKIRQKTCCVFLNDVNIHFKNVEFLIIDHVLYIIREREEKKSNKIKKKHNIV